MKTLFARLSVFTAALGIVAIALCGFIVMRLLAGTQADELLATSPKIPNLPDLRTDAPALDAKLEPVRDRALFYASRAFYVAPPPPAAPTAPPRPNYLFAGSFAIPHKHTVALLKQSTASNVVKVKAGDELEGWHVESVEPSRVLLRYQDEHFEIARATSQLETHLTRAPLRRGGVGATSAAVATAMPDAATAGQATSVRSLGTGRTGPIRDAALRPGQASMEARLYRPPQ